VEVLRLLENGDSSVLGALEAAARQRTDGTKPPGTDAPLDGEPGEDLSSAPDWIKEAYERAKRDVTPLAIDPEDRRAHLMRDRLAPAHKRRNMTQSALARQLGKTPSQISRIFANSQRSRLSTLAGIADALEVDLSDLLRGPGRDERTP
jgi:DNA-binding Xre family transcriptional regulator